MSYKFSRLKLLREERDLKQTDVAEQLGLSRTTLSNYEAGLMPSMENAIALAGFYGVSLDYIAGLSAEKSANAGALTTAFITLKNLAGEAAPTASDVSELADAAILYMCNGQPCGDKPIAAWRDFMRYLTECLTAAANGDTSKLIDSANAAAVAALDVTKMPGMLMTKKG